MHLSFRQRAIAKNLVGGMTAIQTPILSGTLIASAPGAIIGFGAGLASFTVYSQTVRDTLDKRGKGYSMMQRMSELVKDRQMTDAGVYKHLLVQHANWRNNIGLKP